MLFVIFQVLGPMGTLLLALLPVILIAGLAFWLYKKFGNVFKGVANLGKGLKNKVGGILKGIKKNPLKALKYLSPATFAAGMVLENSKPRGAGKIPSECGPDQTRIMGLCYNPCPEGYERVGRACKAKCPEGFFTRRENGPCWRQREERPWFYKGNEGREQCDASDWASATKKGCEQCGVRMRWYPKCKDGWEHMGPLSCKICQKVDCPPGWRKGLRGACLRPRKIQRGRLRTHCKPGRVKQSGLCYNPCPDGYPHGVGPVCWKNPLAKDERRNTLRDEQASADDQMAEMEREADKNEEDDRKGTVEDEKDQDGDTDVDPPKDDEKRDDEKD
jgi:hypothetical protein